MIQQSLQFMALLTALVYVSLPAQVTTAPVYSYRIVNIYNHDPGAFTQGLVYADGNLFEGTGLNGRSSLRKVDLRSGTILQVHDLDQVYFGEGVTVWKNKIIQLTWQSNVGFAYDRELFIRLEEFFYPAEGWGLTHDGTRLIMSDGTETLHFLDPDGFYEIGQLVVKDGERVVSKLNELEYINGEIWANVLPTDRIARIDPLSGKVNSWVDLSGLLSAQERYRSDILNGIAYDEENGRLFVTGKLWPKLFEIEVIE